MHKRPPRETAVTSLRISYLVRVCHFSVLISVPVVMNISYKYRILLYMRSHFVHTVCCGTLVLCNVAHKLSRNAFQRNDIQILFQNNCNYVAVSSLSLP